MFGHFNNNTIQYIAIAGSLLFLFFIFNLVRKKKMREEYSLLWIFLGVIFLGLSLWREGLESISALLGIAYPPAALFLILLLVVFLILIQFSIVVTRLSDNVKQLTQELALLKNKNDARAEDE